MSKKRTAINILSILTIFGVALLYCSKNSILRTTGLIVCIGSFATAFILWKFFWKCPYCGEHLGRIGSSENCPHCGKNIFS